LSVRRAARTWTVTRPAAIVLSPSSAVTDSIYEPRLDGAIQNAAGVDAAYPGRKAPADPANLYLNRASVAEIRSTGPDSRTARPAQSLKPSSLAHRARGGTTGPADLS